MEFKGKVAVVTGGGSGIGRSVALAMAKLGADVVIADINGPRLEDVKREISNTGNRVLAVPCDVSKNADVENLAKETIANMGTVDILMNNAGTAVYGKFENMRITDYERVLGINLLGVIRGVMAFLPYMIEKGSGYIVNTASQAGIDWGVEPYPFSKYAVVGYSERLCMYARPKGVNVSVLCPGLVNTNLFSDSPVAGNESEQKEFKKFSEKMVASAGVLNPDDVARIIIEHIKEKKFFILTPGTERVVDKALEMGRDIRKFEKYLEDNCKEPGSG